MQKRIPFLALITVLLLLMAVSFCGCSEVPTSNETPREEGIKVTDMCGREVKLDGPAEKIVAIGPGALRLVCYINGADKVIGVEEMEKNNPTGRPYFMANQDLQKLPTIGPGGPGSEPDAEKLVSIKPDVVFTCLSLEQAKADELQAKIGIPVVVLNYGTLSCFSEEMYSSFEIIGKITGEEKRAEEVINYLKNCEKDLNDRTKDIPEEEKPSVYVGGVSARGAHGIESSYGKYPPLKAINGKNVVDETGKEGSFSIDKEKLIDWDPEILFIDAGGLELVREDYKKNAAFYNTLSAVKNGEIYCLIPYNWYWTNIDTALADAYYLGKVIYPDQFKDIDPAKMADEIYQFLLGKPLFEEMIELYNEGFKKITLK
ncbi:MAG: iron ABC transporter substrate-binding protein [Dethiobacteria bacterium]|mgnify:FL=1